MDEKTPSSQQSEAHTSFDTAKVDSDQLHRTTTDRKPISQRNVIKTGGLLFALGVYSLLRLAFNNNDPPDHVSMKDVAGRWTADAFAGGERMSQAQAEALFL